MYDYSLVDYKSSKESVTIICSIHGEFEQRPGDHIRGSGCNACAYIERGNSRRKTNETFVTEMKEIHGDRYDYSKVVYKIIEDSTSETIQYVYYNDEPFIDDFSD